MDTASLIVGTSWILVALLLFLLAQPLVKRRVGRNLFYGVRFRQSFTSEQAWKDINEYGGRELVRWSIPLGLLGIALLFVPMEDDAVRALACSLGPIVLVLIPAYRSWRFAVRYAESGR